MLYSYFKLYHYIDFIINKKNFKNLPNMPTIIMIGTEKSIIRNNMNGYIKSKTHSIYIKSRFAINIAYFVINSNKDVKYVIYLEIILFSI